MHTRWQQVIGVTFALLMITAAVSAGTSAAAIAETGTDQPTPTGIQHPGPRETAAVQATTISGCTEISTAGTYELTQDIVNSTADPCIRITANDVVFDGNGHLMDGQGASFSQGVIVRSDDVVIRNLRVTDWDTGIDVNGGDNNTLANITIIDNTDGISVIGANNTLVNSSVTGNEEVGVTFPTIGNPANNTLRNNAISGNSLGVIVNGLNNTLANNAITGNGNLGIELNGFNTTLVTNSITGNNRGLTLTGSNHTLANNSLTGNGGTGIGMRAAENTRLTNNSITRNGGIGIKLHDPNNVLTDNLIADNGGIGVLGQDGSSANTLEGNVITGNGGDGVQINLPSSNHTLANNSVTENGGAGIELRGSAHTIVNNSLRRNADSGIHLRDGASRNQIANNTAVDNARWAVVTRRDTTDTTVTELTIGSTTTVGFRARNIGLQKASPQVGDPDTLQKLDKYVNVSGTGSGDSWIVLNLSYTDSEVAALNESDLRMFRWNGTAWTRIPGHNTVDTTRNVVSANVTNVTHQTVVTIFDKRPNRTQRNLSIMSVSPALIRNPDAFTVRLVGSRLQDASVKLVSPTGQRVTPTDVTRGGNALKASFSLTDPAIGVWRLNATTPDGQQASEPVLIPPEAPLIDTQSTWPMQIVPGRPTEMQATLRNFGTTQGVAIVAVEFSNAMEVKKTSLGQNAEIISNTSGMVLFAQPVAPDGGSTRVSVRFRLDPDHVVFPGQTPNATRTIQIGDRVNLGRVRVLGTLTPSQWDQLKNQSPDHIQRQAVNHTLTRFRRTSRDFNQSISEPVGGSSGPVSEYLRLFFERIQDVSWSKTMSPSTTPSVDSLSQISSRTGHHTQTASQDSSSNHGPISNSTAANHPGPKPETHGEWDVIRTQVTIKYVSIDDNEASADAWEDGLDGNAEPLLEWTVIHEGHDTVRSSGQRAKPIKEDAAGSFWNIESTVYTHIECKPRNPVQVVVTLHERDGSQAVEIIGGLFSALGTVVAVGIEIYGGFVTGGVSWVLIPETIAAGVSLIGASSALGSWVNENEIYGYNFTRFKRSDIMFPHPKDIKVENGSLGATVAVEVDVSGVPRMKGKCDDGKDDQKLDDKKDGKNHTKGPAGRFADVINSIDPNDISAQPTGIRNASFITADEQLRYRVRFENKPNATAAAKDVTVTLPVDPALDFDTIQTRASSHPAVMNVTKNKTSRTVTWEFSNINLPPNDNPPEGEGFVEFTARPRANLSSGTTITENASIQFEFNPPIATNNVTHTVDSTPPDTQVVNLSSPQPTNIQVPWNGSDAPGGAGLNSVKLWVAEGKGNTSFSPVAVSNASDRNFTFDGDPNTTYRFTTTGRDRLGNAEPLNTTTNVTIRTKGVGDYDRTNDGNDVIDTSELLVVIDEWVNGKIDTPLLTKAVRAWTNGTPV